MEPTTADGSPLMVKSSGSFIPMEWRIFLWPPKRDVSLANIFKELSDPALYERHGVSASMMMSSDECHQAAKRIEEEAFNAYAHEPPQIDSGLPVFRAYWSNIRKAIITTVKSRGPCFSTGPRNDEIDKKKAKLLEEGGAKSRPAPQKGMVHREFVIYKEPDSTVPPVSFEDSHKGFYKHLLRNKPIPTTLPDGHPPGPSPSVSAKNFICGQAQPFDLSDDEVSRVANLLASETVKEYNNRQFEDKLELVKVTKGTGSGVAGYLYNLTFDAKVLGDGGGGTIKTYQAKVWLKIDGTLQVISFKLTDDGQGKEVWFWESH